VENVQDKFLIIDQHFDAKLDAKPDVKVDTKPDTKTHITKKDVLSHETKEVPSQKSKLPEQSHAPEEEEAERLVAKFVVANIDSLDHLISNDVLEWERQRIKEQITQLTSQGKPVPEDLEEREQAVGLKINLLQVQVETGQLTQDTYFAQLKAKVAEETALARKYALFRLSF
jgi:hypothetical protein